MHENDFFSFHSKVIDLSSIVDYAATCNVLMQKHLLIINYLVEIALRHQKFNMVIAVCKWIKVQWVVHCRV